MIDNKKPWDKGTLCVSSNGRYLANGETPFFLAWRYSLADVQPLNGGGSLGISEKP